jgi:hypothetical protein
VLLLLLLLLFELKVSWLNSWQSWQLQMLLWHQGWRQ